MSASKDVLTGRRVIVAFFAVQQATVMLGVADVESNIVRLVGYSRKEA